MARKQRVAIDAFTWEFNFLDKEQHITTPAKDGAFVTGLFLEGAKWDEEKKQIIEAEPMKLHYDMPTIHFKPVERLTKQKKLSSSYACPCYYYPIRGGVKERPSYQFTVMLPLKPNPSSQGTQDQDYWIKRGTALLMSKVD